MQTLSMMLLAVDLCFDSVFEGWSLTGVFGSRSLPPTASPQSQSHTHTHTHTHACMWPAEVCGQPNNERFSVNTVSRLPQIPQPSAAEILLTKLSPCVCVCVCVCVYVCVCVCSYKVLDLLNYI